MRSLIKLHLGWYSLSRLDAVSEGSRLGNNSYSQQGELSQASAEPHPLRFRRMFS